MFILITNSGNKIPIDYVVLEKPTSYIVRMENGMVEHYHKTVVRKIVELNSAPIPPIFRCERQLEGRTIRCTWKFRINAKNTGLRDAICQALRNGKTRGHAGPAHYLEVI